MRHALIVGAGPAGAALACLLARRNLQVTLLERQTGFEREFRFTQGVTTVTLTEPRP